jgi:hypothetical protein
MARAWSRLKDARISLRILAAINRSGNASIRPEAAIALLEGLKFNGTRLQPMADIVC